MASTAQAANIPWSNQIVEIPPEHRPHAAYVDLVRRLEPLVTQVLGANAIPREQWADLTALSAVDLVVRARAVAPVGIASNMIAAGVVAGSKTVPHPIPG